MVRYLDKSLFFIETGSAPAILAKPAFPSAVNTFAISPTVAMGSIIKNTSAMEDKFFTSTAVKSSVASISRPARAMLPNLALRTYMMDTATTPISTKAKTVSCFFRHMTSLIIRPFIAFTSFCLRSES